MSTLSDRIAWLHGPVSLAPNGDVDGNIGNDNEIQYKNYGAVKSIPLTRVQIFPNGILTYDEPIISTNGAPISSTGPYTWGQLYAAGRY